MAELPLAPVERVMRKAGIYRISLEAIKVAAEEAEDYIENLARSAQRIAMNSGRKTITSRDIKIASKQPHAVRV